MNFKYELKELPNKGTGIVTLEFIPKGAVTWRMTPQNCRFYTKKEEVEAHLAKLGKDEIDYFFTHVFTSNDRIVLIQDDTIYTNHDDNPNIKFDHDRGESVAQRDIHPGEEITESYLNYTRIPWYDQLANKHGHLDDSELVESFRKASTG